MIPQIDAGDSIDKTHIINLLHYYATSKEGSFGHYQTLTVDNQIIPGRRNPLKRLKNVPYDFTGKTVLDIGTNLGGMLFALSSKIQWGVGIDYHVRAINFANRLKSSKQTTYKNLAFYVFDLDKEPLEKIVDFLPDNKVDICFMLAMANWVKRWREVIDLAARIAPALLYEANGSISFKTDQVKHLQNKYKQVIKVHDRSDDDTDGDTSRQLYLCLK
jgi:hypothetical protein